MQSTLAYVVQDFAMVSLLKHWGDDRHRLGEKNTLTYVHGGVYFALVLLCKHIIQRLDEKWISW